MDKDEDMTNDEQQQDKDLSLLQVGASVLAAGFGVQSKENKQRDFTRGKPIQFIIVGIFFTAALMAILIGVVSWVLP